MEGAVGSSGEEWAKNKPKVKKEAEATIARISSSDLLKAFSSAGFVGPDGDYMLPRLFGVNTVSLSGPEPKHLDWLRILDPCSCLSKERDNWWGERDGGEEGYRRHLPCQVGPKAQPES